MAQVELPVASVHSSATGGAQEPEARQSSEQQSLDCVQRLSLVGSLHPHTPPVHTSLKQSEVDWQCEPVPTAAQLPAWQLPLQQSEPAAHEAPTVAQAWQVPRSQMFEQQSLASEQEVRSCWQVPHCSL